MKRGWCGSSWSAEALDSPCHEGAGDLVVPDVTEQKREERDARSEDEHVRRVLEKYRDAGRDLLCCGGDGGWRSGR
jgi:hypothetical protein